MPFCSNCGTKLPPDATLCPNCGTPTTKAVAAPPAPSVSTVPPAPPTPPPVKTPFLQRMIRAMKLDAKLFEEVEHDPAATKQVLLVIVLVSVSSSIGAGIRSMLAGEYQNIILEGGLRFVSTLLALLIWAGITYFIGTKLFGGVATYGEMFRSVGFSYAPGLFYIVEAISTLLTLVIGLWILAAMVIAVREALDITTGKAIATAIIGYILLVAFTTLLLLI